MQCTVCGQQNPAEAKLCSSCASPLDAVADNGYTPFLAKNVRLKNGAYAVGEVLGQGGFGITYKGGDLSLRRYVAIKEFFPQGSIRHNSTLRPDRTLSPADYNAVKAKFIDEAHRLALFSHPSIVRVFGVFEENNTAYMVMEFLEGQSLLQKITEKRSLSEGEVVDIANKIGDALAAVHAAGLIHRDIKPDNIMLTGDGRVVLIDFGTARSFASNKTVKQTAMLTPGYAPLEQYGQQARFGAYTDIYALGATLYHALTGEVPPPATDLASGVELKAPHTINPYVSQSVSNAILWAMKVKADERPQNVKAFLEVLNKPAPVATPQPTPVPMPKFPAPNFPSPLPPVSTQPDNLRERATFADITYITAFQYKKIVKKVDSGNCVGCGSMNSIVMKKCRSCDLDLPWVVASRKDFGALLKDYSKLLVVPIYGFASGLLCIHFYRSNLYWGPPAPDAKYFVDSAFCGFLLSYIGFIISQGKLNNADSKKTSFEFALFLLVAVVICAIEILKVTNKIN